MLITKSFKTYATITLLATMWPVFAKTFVFFRDEYPFPSANNGSEDRYQVRFKDKWGFVDRKGNIVVQPAFEREGDFSQGVAKVRIEGRWGYINRHGKIVIPCKYSNAGDMRNGAAPVAVNDKWGYIGANGNILVQPAFKSAAEFSFGLARVETWPNPTCLETLDAALQEPCSKYGFIDRSGGLAIAATFNYASTFSEGMAMVRTGPLAGSKCGYIDTHGAIVIMPTFDDARPFFGGLAAVETQFREKNGKQISGAWGFINKRGSFAVIPKFELVRDFSEGLASVRFKDGRSGYIDKNGLTAVEPDFSEADSFRSGIATVVSFDDGTSRYLIDRAGRKVIIATQLEPQMTFAGGLILVGRPGQLKYANKQGELIASYDSDSMPVQQ